MPVYNSITGVGTPPPDSSFDAEVIRVTEDSPPELEAPDPDACWPWVRFDTSPAGTTEVGSAGGGGRLDPPDATASVVQNDGVDLPPSDHGKGPVVGFEAELAAQVFLGASLKVGLYTDTNGRFGIGITPAVRAGWDFGAGLSVGPMVAPGARGVDSLQGPNLSVSLDAAVVSGEVGWALANHGPEAAPSGSIAPSPKLNVGVMVGVSPELGYTAIMSTGPQEKPAPEDAPFWGVK